MQQQSKSEEDRKFLIRHIISILAGALMICTPALRNGFPFLYTDTGTYLHCGLNGVASEIRPMIYGLFIRIISLHDSVWLVAGIQCLIVSWTIHFFYFQFTRKPVAILPLCIIFLLTLMTGLGEESAMLMPDFMTPVIILLSAAILFGRRIKPSKLFLISLLFIFGVACHHSNAYILFFTLGFSLLINYIFNKFHHLNGIPLRKYFFLTLLTLAGYFLIPFINWSYSGEFYWSKIRNVFLTNRINQIGLLKPYLHENCIGQSFFLCDSIDQIPNDLLWSPKSPLRKNGSLSDNNEPLRPLVHDFFQHRFFVKKFFIKTIENGFVQFFTIEGLIMTTEREEGYHYQVFDDEWPEFIPAIRRTTQFAGKWDSTATQFLQRFLVYGSFLFLLIFFVWKRGNVPLETDLFLFRFMLLALMLNAFICAGISMVDVRFQYRVIWIVPLFALIHFANVWPEIRAQWNTSESKRE